ncbi:receptor-like protein 9DC3 [Diospyros lotus]|uniref:receptor-like protein 9DC3 n=1 Tax=Diospyros lotus TaxID=55363 RepID=UPI002256F20E|nr:receptor-like protein 9DC3 [Diospyros lotus]
MIGEASGGHKEVAGEAIKQLPWQLVVAAGHDGRGFAGGWGGDVGSAREVGGDRGNWWWQPRCAAVASDGEGGDSAWVEPLCHSEESSALLQFKQAFFFNKSVSSDPLAYWKLRSWKFQGGGASDCCSWDGVECDQSTGHVVGLDLSSSFLFGSIKSSSSLFSLVHLRRLNLADNHFNHSQIPLEISHLLLLTTLNLSLSSFSGPIPVEISRLSKLISLDLSQNSGTLRLEKPGLQSLLQNLTSLEEIHLDKVNITSKLILPNISSLATLSLRACGLYGTFPTSIFHLPKLRVLNLHGNHYLTGHLSEFQHSSQLQKLILASTNFSGELPNTIGNLSFLDTLHLSGCNFLGSIPASLNRTQLRYLDLSYNEFDVGSMFWLWDLTSLTTLLLNGIDLQGSILSSPANKIQHATVGLSNSTALLNFKWLEFDSCNLIEFPYFLSFQNQLEVLSLVKNKIHGQIPAWMLNISKDTLMILSLRGNYLTGFEQQPIILPWAKLGLLDLSHNKLQGRLPIPPTSIHVYSASNNAITGKLSPLICTLSSVFSLELSNNNLTGLIPPCLSNFSDSLSVLDLGGNNFYGPIPQAYDKGNKLELIGFAGNRLSGKLPKSLANCAKLKILDISNNLIQDAFPSWLGTLTELEVLNLQSNKFYGAVRSPRTKFESSKLRIIVLSHNSFSGDLPTKYIRSWNAMKSIGEEEINRPTHYVMFQFLSISWERHFFYTMTMTNKGVNTVYNKTLDIFVGIDLSSNKFEGGIPKSLGDLKVLQLLNLSNNELSGGIPSFLGDLSNLEALDLAQNKLSGEIPQQLTQLTFLAFFNVSYNNLTGLVPKGNQFNTFQNNSYEWNLGLCGESLSRNCGELDAPSPTLSLSPVDFEGNNDSIFPSGVDWTIICMGFGSGMTIGLAIGQMLTSKYHEWFLETFARKKTIKEERGRGNCKLTRECFMKPILCLALYISSSFNCLV